MAHLFSISSGFEARTVPPAEGKSHYDPDENSVLRVAKMSVLVCSGNAVVHTETQHTPQRISIMINAETLPQASPPA